MAVSQLLTVLGHGEWRSRWADIEQHWSPIKALLMVVVLSVLYQGFIFVRGLYRRYLHPLRKFPGHPEACVSTAWAFNEAMKGFPEQTFEILHKVYSKCTRLHSPLLIISSLIPQGCLGLTMAHNLWLTLDTKLLRVGPNELHISDPEVYKDIYKQVDPFPKYEPFYLSFNAPHTVFSEVDVAKHKERRRLLNPLFSRAGILKLEPLIREKLSMLDNKVNRLSHQQQINVYDAFR